MPEKLKWPDRVPDNQGVSMRWDHEKVPQPDGSLAVFSANPRDNFEWRFCHFEDEHGFAIHDNEKTVEGRINLADHEVPFEEVSHGEPAPMEAAKEGEILKAYRYGGILSSRAGYFIVKADNPTEVIRSKMIWMS